MLFLSRKIWSKFLEFESNVGDLASIIKVEKRLSLVLKEVIDKYISSANKLFFQLFVTVFLKTLLLKLFLKLIVKNLKPFFRLRN